MTKRILILIFLICLFLPFQAEATTQYYYLRTTGAGSNSGDTGTWVVVPTTGGNAMSASNFNDSGNWSATDDANKLDADDVVYVKGSWGGGYNLSSLILVNMLMLMMQGLYISESRYGSIQ